MRIRSNSAQSPFSNSRRKAKESARSRLAPAHPGLPQTGMDNLLMSALHSAATDSIAQPQILVIAHAPGILTVVADERLQTLAQFRGFRPQAFQGGDHLLHLAGPQVFGNLMNPPEHHTRLFCHPNDVSNPIQVHHLTKPGSFMPSCVVCPEAMESGQPCAPFGLH